MNSVTAIGNDNFILLRRKYVAAVKYSTEKQVLQMTIIIIIFNSLHKTVSEAETINSVS